MNKINWSNDFYSDMFSLDFDCFFQPLTYKVSCILLWTQLIIGNRTSCRTIQGNRARNFKPDFKFQIFSLI